MRRESIRDQSLESIFGSAQAWGYAATFGAMWGAIEITVGTFAHSLRLPLAGVLLASVGMALLIALRMIYPKSGVLLAAGVVCAGIKLLTPIGAVVGPIVAILVEASLAEVIFSAMGVGVISVSLASSMAATGALLQKLITQVILYGLPVLGIYRGLVERAGRFFGLDTQRDWALVASLIVLVSVEGVSVGLAGRWVGTRALERLRMGGDR